MAQLKCTNVNFSCNGSTVFSVDGANGRLLEVTDDLSNSIFSANTIAGLPVIEAFANNCVSMGQFGGHKFEVTNCNIRGGKCTTSSGKYSFVGGGCRNTNSGYVGVIVGGACNTASGFYPTVVGGVSNIAASDYSYIGGGLSNRACNYYTSVGGGDSNKACNYSSTIGGGSYNSASGYQSTIGGGYFNTAGGNYNFVGGGSGNTASGAYSSILGGQNNTNGQTNSHIIGSGITANAANYTFVNNLCQIGGGISDCRVKNTIQSLEFGLNHITKLQPVSYCWNGDSSCHKKYGFIAQNVQEALPCVVTINPLHKLSTNNTQQVGGEGEPLLEFEKDAVYASYVNAFKDLKAENDALKQRMDTIETILKQNGLL